MYQKVQEKEPMIQYEALFRSCQEIEKKSFFHLEEETDMLVAGYNSKFPFVCKMHNTYTMQALCTPWTLY